MNELSINSLRAGVGDCFHIRYRTDRGFKNILIDGGYTIAINYRNLKKYLQENIFKYNEILDLVVVTHIDDDHIRGIYEMVKDFQAEKIIGKLWYNSIREENYSRKISIRKAFKFEDIIKEEDFWTNCIVTPTNYTNDNMYKIFDNYCKISVLCPGRKQIESLLKEVKKASKINNKKYYDHDKTFGELMNEVNDDGVVFSENSINESSIVLLLEIHGRKLLFLADSNPDVVMTAVSSFLEFNNLQKLNIDLVKVSHHGSENNTSTKLLRLINCNNYLISSDGNRGKLPDKIVLAKILSLNESNENYNFFFNYQEENYDLKIKDNEKKDFAFECFFPKADSIGIRINFNNGVVSSESINET